MNQLKFLQTVLLNNARRQHDLNKHTSVGDSKTVNTDFQLCYKSYTLNLDPLIPPEISKANELVWALADVPVFGILLFKFLVDAPAESIHKQNSH